MANFPATQNVGGTVNVGNLPATQNVAGSVSSSDSTSVLYHSPPIFGIQGSAANSQGDLTVFDNLDVSRAREVRLSISCSGVGENCGSVYYYVYADGGLLIDQVPAVTGNYTDASKVYEVPGAHLSVHAFPVVAADVFEAELVGRSN